jgi:eukaryotic-like serine/threonine-protein kinase
MSIVPGTKVGPYDILGAIGAGGMGEVYRARDAKLGRDVAIKVLPEAFARDAERMARFQREAKLLASLNHPNIAAIYGFEDSGGTHALVMELVEGPTLADRIRQGPIPIDEALKIAKQICEALEYAHERGVVHRDLKPANIKVTNDDAVKVLDFGLAKAIEGDASSMDMANSPTLTRMATMQGVLLGTAAYMSPEQAKAKPVDRRADIWAFGCVLYEMLTGKMAFTGETVSDTLAAVIKEEADWTQLPAGTPVRVRVLLQRCLQKDPKQRLRDIGDARISLDEVLAGAPELIAATAVPSKPRGRRAIFSIVGTAGLIIVGFAAYFLGRNTATRALPAMHFSAVTNFSGVQGDPSLSPDGRSVAFISNRDGRFNIYVTLVHGGNLVQVTRDANLKRGPIWSPDGATLAYAQINESGVWDIWEVPALGGTPRRVILNAADPAWSPDGHSLAYFNPVDGAIWISGVSGENAHLAVPPWEAGGWDTQPRFSPDGRRLAFAARYSDGAPYDELAVADLDSGKTRLLTHDNALALSPAWSSDGRFIYFASSRGGTINIWKIAASGGEPQQITAGEGDDADLDVSADGKRIVFGTLRQKVAIAQLDLHGSPGQQSVRILTADPARNQFGPAYSPDGKYLAYFTNLKGAEREAIWVSDADGSNARALVEDAMNNVFPEWTHGGNAIIFLTNPNSGASVHWQLRRVSISGGAPEKLADISTPNLPDVGRDGRVLIGQANAEIDTFDPSDGKTEKLGTLPVQSVWGVVLWSPDERSVAYMRAPSAADDPNAGLWVDDFKSPPRQLFRGWVLWYSREQGNEIDFLEGRPDLSAVLWKVNWDGQGLTQTQWKVPVLYYLNYFRTIPGVEFSASPDGRYLAFQTDQVLEENIGMIENVQ